MLKSLNKYWTQFFSLILLIGLISSNAGLCGIYVEICNTAQESSSCCCQSSDTDFPLQIDKNCCCEIKASPTQPAEINLSLTESLPKSQSYFVKTNFYNVDMNELHVTRLEFNSTHSPPGKDIYLFNSNLRI